MEKCLGAVGKKTVNETFAAFIASELDNLPCPKQQVAARRKLCATLFDQMNSLAASVKLTYSASMVDRPTDFCLKVRDEIGVSSIKVMNPPIDIRSSLFVAKSESE
ncbi:hypothetical protein TNCV_3124831 [Trichonephila clavipes]|nr:hypothetical protein TNCV_3124831 [Trichonephila clavipes]